MLSHALVYFSNDEDLPDAAIRPMINMFLYSMRDDVPKQEQDVQGRSRSTIHGIALLNVLPEFVKQVYNYVYKYIKVIMS